MMFSFGVRGRFGRLLSFSTILIIIMAITAYIQILLGLFLCSGCFAAVDGLWRIIIILDMFGTTHRGRRSIMWLWIPKCWRHQQVGWLVLSCFDDLELIHLNVIGLSWCGTNCRLGATDRLWSILDDTWSHILWLSRVVDRRCWQMWVWRRLHSSILTCLVTMLKIPVDGTFLLLLILVLFSCRRVLLILLLFYRSKSALCC